VSEENGPQVDLTVDRRQKVSGTLPICGTCF